MRGHFLIVLVLLLAAPCGRTETIAPITPPRLDTHQHNLDSFFPDRKREALVYIRFNMTAQGQMTDLELDEGGFHDQAYVDAAMAIARRLRFIPATQDGKPVEYMGGRIPIRFQLPARVNSGNKVSVTPDFFVEIKKVEALIKNDDLAGAHFHAQWMMAEKVTLAVEYAFLQSTLAYTHARAGHIHSALAASRQVTAHAGMTSQDYQPGGPIPKLTMRDFLLNRDLTHAMLEMRFNLAASQGFFLDALQAHADMQALDMVQPEEPSMAAFQKMLSALQTAPSLLGHVRMDEAKEWNHRLWFNHFAVSSLREGSLSDVMLTCAGYSRKLVWAADVEWTVPSRWKNCSVKFAGSPGTLFDIVEYRDTPAGAVTVAN